MKIPARFLAHLRLAGLLGTLLLPACQPGSLRGTDYAAYLNRPENGLVQSVTVAGKVRLTARYVPPGYAAFQEMQQSGLAMAQATLDSLTARYANSTTFVLTLTAVDADTDLRALLYRDAANVAELSEAMTRLDVEMPNRLHLLVGGKPGAPSLCARENAPGLNRKVDFVLVFPQRITPAAGPVALVFDDVFFQTGKNTLVFEGRKLATAPALTLQP